MMCLIVNVHDIFFLDVYNNVLLRIVGTHDWISDCKKSPVVWEVIKKLDTPLCKRQRYMSTALARTTFDGIRGIRQTQFIRDNRSLYDP